MAVGEFTGRDFSAQDLEATLGRALRSVAILAAVGFPVAWWLARGRGGWQTGALFLVGALIAGTGILEWQRLMMAILSRFEEGGTPRPFTSVVVWFFLRLGIAAAVLYVSLRFLSGSVYALCAGLGLAVLALLIEALRLLRAWSL
jgi:hypothetical protein